MILVDNWKQGANQILTTYNYSRLPLLSTPSGGDLESVIARVRNSWEWEKKIVFSLNLWNSTCICTKSPRSIVVYADLESSYFITVVAWNNSRPNLIANCKTCIFSVTDDFASPASKWSLKTCAGINVYTHIYISKAFKSMETNAINI